MEIIGLFNIYSPMDSLILWRFPEKFMVPPLATITWHSGTGYKKQFNSLAILQCIKLWVLPESINIVTFFLLDMSFYLDSLRSGNSIQCITRYGWIDFLMLDVIFHFLNIFLLDISFYIDSFRSGNSFQFFTRYGQIHFFFLWGWFLVYILFFWCFLILFFLLFIIYVK